MKVFDVSQEVYNCKVFPGDPAPAKMILLRVANGDVCNLSAFTMCAHNGTHVDAPYHFLDDGKTIDQISLNSFVGLCYVAEAEGEVSGERAGLILAQACGVDPESAKRILIKGNAVVTEDAARVFAGSGVVLVGNESQTVGPEDAPANVHNILLGAGTVLLEGIRLHAVNPGVYLLSAAPLNLGGSDGAPCRALLIDLGEKSR